MTKRKKMKWRKDLIPWSLREVYEPDYLLVFE